MARLLETHRDIYLVEQKEPHFFSKDRKYESGLELYRSYYPDYRGHAFTMDASQSYLPLPFMPRRIAETLGRDIRIIVSLRNPIDRVVSAFSHYKMLRRAEFRSIAHLVPEPAKRATLADLLAYERHVVSNGLACGRFKSRNVTFSKLCFPFNYFYVSCYSSHIANWLKVFPDTCFLFLTFEQVTQDQENTAWRIAQFLSIDPNDFDTSRSFHKNPSSEYRREIFEMLVPLRALLSQVLPKPAFRKLRDLARRWLKGRPQYGFEEEVYQGLTRLFRPEIRRVEEVTGLDLSSWKPRP